MVNTIPFDTYVDNTFQGGLKLRPLPRQQGLHQPVRRHRGRPRGGVAEAGIPQHSGDGDGDGVADRGEYRRHAREGSGVQAGDRHPDEAERCGGGVVVVQPVRPEQEDREGVREALRHLPSGEEGTSRAGHWVDQLMHICCH
ncbi:unnamed protein product [Musa acuminata subsp. burmannicoides]